MRRAAKVDASHGPIVDALRQAGCSVYYMRGEKGAPDLVVGVCGQVRLVECKTKRGKLNEAQIKWHNAWRGSPVAVLRSVDEAQAWLNTILPIPATAQPDGVTHA